MGQTTMIYERLRFGTTLVEIGIGRPTLSSQRVVGWAARVEDDGRLTPLSDFQGRLLYGTFDTAEDAAHEIRQRLFVILGPQLPDR